ncbi:MAG: HAD-IA family hydrolase [Chloroflexi bacterium]|nr:HAD-IA family hydrolase [Chloroflexota bacterium]
MRYRAVLFDLDGTLLDTLEDIADSVNAVLDRLGLRQHSLEAYKRFIGDGVQELANRALPEDKRDPVTVAQVVSAIREEYNKRWADKTRPYEGIPKLLDALAARGIKMAVWSNKPDDVTILTVSRLLPRWRFEAVMGAQSAMPKKPDPTGATEIAKRLNIPPGEFLYLGDGDTDMKAASAAGMYPVGALWGFRTRNELLAGGAKKLIRHPMDLVKLL